MKARELKNYTDNLPDFDYAKTLELLLNLTAPINHFFDNVLVMDKQEEIKLNRLALLKDIWTLASSIADFFKTAVKICSGLFSAALERGSGN